MIISNIIGGLGNQMFQYAAGRALSLKLRTPLKLDIREFSGYQLHQGFELNRLFNCNAEIATNDDLDNVLSWQKAKLVQRILRRPQLKNLRYKSFAIEPHFNYWSGFKLLGDNNYLYGYWQSEQYFIEFEEQIRKDFTFKLPLSAKNSAIIEQISQVNAVSLHVRRGDYVTNAKNAFIGVCSLEYYRKAVEYVKNQVDKPVFFVFSDDIEWVKSNLPIDFPCIYIDYNHGIESFNDMRLMSHCKHHIIANSSFSWWGAWLNANSEKIVIAPQQWFANNTNVNDLLPESWIKL
jgi:hypothetical protein